MVSRSPTSGVPPSGDPHLRTLVESLLQRLREGGLRSTRQREQVVQALVETGEQHPTAEQIHATLHARGLRVSLATVYNTLESLRFIGAVSELGFPETPTRYDLNQEPHANLVCTKCGRIEDLDASALARSMRQRAQRMGYLVVRERMDVYGLCPPCRRAAGAPVHGRPGERPAR